MKSSGIYCEAFTWAWSKALSSIDPYLLIPSDFVRRGPIMKYPGLTILNVVYSIPEVQRSALKVLDAKALISRYRITIRLKYARIMRLAPFRKYPIILILRVFSASAGYSHQERKSSFDNVVLGLGIFQRWDPKYVCSGRYSAAIPSVGTAQSLVYSLMCPMGV